MIDFIALAQQCAPTVEPHTMAAVAHVESDYNPYAIGVVGGHLKRQPQNIEEAVATAESLEKNNWNFSLGMSQVNRYNLPKYHITYRQAFDPCTNLQTGSKILEDCYTRAHTQYPQQDKALNAAFSCYYSGNFTRGFRPDKPGQSSYVQKVLLSADAPIPAIPVVPAIKNPRTQTAPSVSVPEKTRTEPQQEVQSQKQNPLVFYDMEHPEVAGHYKESNSVVF